MRAAEIRQSFLDFFRDKGHEIVPSSPVVLPADPTLLFTNAGMNQFKEIFLGARTPAHPRVANSQKCIRVSGKHNDLEEVGYDTYHHTFFEMLGNWSFGDYYKREAIAWAWELLTRVWKLPPERLWATVYKDDDEAEALWRELTSIDPAHILRFDETDNFWEMGETGPCGPCSEIHVDLTPDGSATADLVNAGRPDLIEIWNLVFIQYNRRADGSLEELPAKHVDTGMGFERVVAVLQGKASNYDTDVFQPLIGKVAELSGRAYAGDDAVAMRVIADHVRTLSLAIADGVIPSNEGRGYVLRRLLRRAVRYGRNLGLERPFLGDLLPTLTESLGDAYPELRTHRQAILRALKAEEESFAATLGRGLVLFEKTVARTRAAGATTFPGEDAFKLYDTYGFPLDLTVLMAREQGLEVDEAEFERHMEAQRTRGRKAREEGGAGARADLVADLVAQGLTSTFVGYGEIETHSEVIALAGPDGLTDSLSAGQTGSVLLRETPFYGEAGGQVGDHGMLVTPHGVFAVQDTQKPAAGIILHIGEVAEGTFRVGETAKATVDEDRRAALARHHSATHLMAQALRDRLGSGVRQAGSLVAPDRLRFDFTHFEGVSRSDLAEVERQVNAWIRQDDEVRTYEIDFKDVAGSGIVAVFDEKYGDRVRVVDIGGYSKELCGGTHVDRVGRLGFFRILSEGSVASGVRRIEAVVGADAVALAQADRDLLHRLAESFSVPTDQLADRVQGLMHRTRELEKTLRQQAQQVALAQTGCLVAQARSHGGVRIVAAPVPVADADALAGLRDAVLKELGSGVVVLGANLDGKAAFVCAVSPDLVKQGWHAGKLIGAVAKAAGGGGGGKPEAAQAGAKDGTKVAEALHALDGILGVAAGG